MLTGKRFGLSKTYLWTDAASGLYERFGWKKIDRIHYADEDVDIMTVDLSTYS
jgi:predicted acetyltransferase